MIDSAFLEGKISLSGYKKQYIAKRMGLTRFGLHKKINNETEFKTSEIRILCEVLKLTNKERDRIFFACEVI